MVNEHHIEVKKTASFYILGNLKTAKKIWFVLHGYGYSAKYFIKKFENIVDDKTAIIAPEGLSRFYLKGVEGRVGASWMTKEDRENEIKDYINYLNLLYKKLIGNPNNVTINVLGFSQGGATASRWISDRSIKIDNFILWASAFPDEMNFDNISTLKSYFIYGDNDEYVTEERVERQKKIMPNHIEVSIFKGSHDIPNDALIELAKKNNW